MKKTNLQVGFVALSRLELWEFFRVGMVDGDHSGLVSVQIEIERVGGGPKDGLLGAYDLDVDVV